MKEGQRPSPDVESASVLNLEQQAGSLPAAGAAAGDLAGELAKEIKKLADAAVSAWCWR